MRLRSGDRQGVQLRPASVRNFAAHRNVLARDPSRLFIHQQQDSVADISRRPGAVLGPRQVDFGLHEGLLVALRVEVYQDGAGRDGIDCDASGPAELFALLASKMLLHLPYLSHWNYSGGDNPNP